MNGFQKGALILNVFVWGTIGPYLILSVTLNISNPFYMVGSQSMFPALKQGDFLIVEGCSNAYVGNIIVFESPKRVETEEGRLITHRITSSQSVNGTVYYETKGDNNPYPDYWTDYRGKAFSYNGMVSNNLLIGKVKYVIPYLGAVIIFLQTPTGAILWTILVIALIFGEVFSYKMSHTKKK